MADLTGSLTSNARVLSNGSRYIILDFTQTRIIASNESEIAWSLKGAGTYSGYVMAGPFTVSIDNKQVYSNSTRIKLYKGTVIASGKTIVKHNDDGSKQLPISISAAVYEYAVNVRGSQTFTLVPNPQESTITASDTQIGKKCIININKSVDSYTSTLSYKLYKDDSKSAVLASNTIATKISEKLYEWEILPSFYDLLWNTQKGYCEIACETYNGDTKVGNTKSINIWITMDETVNPTILEYSALNTDPKINVITGENGYVEGQGLITVKCSATANKSAQISSITVTSGTKVYSLENGVASQINNPENSVFVFTITDSRGNTDSQSVELIAYDYIVPSISIADLKMELVPSDNTKARITFSVDGTGYKGYIGSTLNNPTIEFTITDESGQSETIVNTVVMQWSEKIDDYYTDYKVEGITTQVDNPDATYKVKAIIKDLINTDGISSAELGVNRVPVYDYGKNDFNFNVPIYYKDRPYIDTQYESMEFSVSTSINGEPLQSTDQVDWIYQIIQGTYVNMWGKATIDRLSFTKDVGKGEMYTMDQALKIPIPVDIVVGYNTYPYTVNASITHYDNNEEYNATAPGLIMTASPYIYIEGNESYATQYVIVPGLSPEYITGLTCYVSIHITGIKIGALEYNGGYEDDWDDEEDWGDDFPEDEYLGDDYEV